MRRPSGWGPALRVARRDVWRNKARAMLVVLMIALPVAAVSGADVFLRTADISGSERLEWRLGAADARIDVEPGARAVEQGADPDRGGYGWMDADGVDPVVIEDVRRILGRDVPAVEWRHGTGRVQVTGGTASPEINELDLTDPLVEGLFELVDGRLPATGSEVVITQRLAERGVAIGDTVSVSGAERERSAERDVVGIIAWGAGNYPLIAGPLGSLGAAAVPGDSTWLVGGGEVTWAEVRALNRVGATVASRAVIETPPPASEVPEGMSPGTDSAVVAVTAMVVAMVLLEVILLAGPAFAVTARRQARTIALMVATGATGAQARRVVLANALVLGVVAAALGLVVGVIGAGAAVAVAGFFTDSRLGPFEVAPLDLMVVAGFGVLSAVLAAIVPATIAARQDVVAVLAGRRGDRAPSLRSPLLGIVLLAAGIGAATYGVLSSGSELMISFSAVPVVLGMILVVPALVAGVARLSGSLPLPLRYAVRDANRHRTRTVPAVAAVAATVVGAVALGIGATSDAKEAEVMYEPNLPMHTSALMWTPWEPMPADSEATERAETWARFRAVLERESPQAEVTEIYGLPAGSWSQFRLPGQGEDDWLMDNWGSAWGSELVVADRLTGVLAKMVPQAELAAANQVLADGGAIVFTNRAERPDRVQLQITVEEENDADDREPGSAQTTEIPARFLDAGRFGLVTGIVSTSTVRELGVAEVQTALAIDDAVPASAATSINEALLQLSDEAHFSVERGYERGNDALLIVLVLGALAGVLMLGGTLTATFLSLSDARADLATLAAVGAAPRLRRAVAASYALFIGGLGAAVGALVGFVPGIAVSFPLTSTQFYGGPVDPTVPSHFLAIPWGLIAAVVVVLPLLTAAVVWASARSRLPMVARID